MAKVLITDTHMTDIADAIREKLGVATTYTPDQMAVAIESIPSGGITPTGTINITENGTVDVTQYATANVAVSGGVEKLYELYGATFGGGTQTFEGIYDNSYIACCYHDNMSSTYTLNGVSGTYTASAPGKGGGTIFGVTKAVSDNTSGTKNAIRHFGSVFISYHNDSGSYMSVVGGWVGYPAGGSIYDNAVSDGATNTITMNAAHHKLLIFLGGSNSGMSSVTTVDINGTTYSVTNMGTRYDGVYSVYAAIEIDDNSDSTITLTFPVACYNYMSIIGID